MKKIIAALFAIASLQTSFAGEQKLEISTFNIKHTADEDQLSEISKLITNEADLVFLQEVKFWSGGKNNSAKFIAERLNYHVVATKRSSDSEGIAIVTPHPILESSWLEYKAQTSPLLLGFKRKALSAVVETPAGNVLAVDIHLTNWGFEGHIRRKQIAETLEWMKALLNSQERKIDYVVLAGDFNADKNSDEMKSIFEAELPGKFTFQDFNRETPTMGNRRIDFIFLATARSVASHEEEVIGSFSDHRHPIHRYRFEAASASDE